MFGTSAFSQTSFAALPVTGSSNISLLLSGVAAVGALGNASPVISIVPLASVVASGTVGTVSRGGTSIALTGSAASGLLGTFGVDNTRVPLTVSPFGRGYAATMGAVPSFALTSVAVVGAVGTIKVLPYWRLIDDTQDANWQNINSAGTTVWAALDTSGNATWQNISTSETANWSEIDTAQTAGWQVENTN